jgi:hypothetical protein
MGLKLRLKAVAKRDVTELDNENRQGEMSRIESDYQDPS